VQTASGSVELARPRVRDASKLGFESRLLGKHVTRTYALESLVIGSFLRGLSTRDVEAVLEETFDEPISSRSTVSRILDDTRDATGAGASAGSQSTTSSIASSTRST
jgi:putative transposase